MITEAKSRQVAIELIHIGMCLLLLLDDETGKDYSRQSINRQDLDRIAQRFGFPNAQTVWTMVEEEELYKEYSGLLYEGEWWTL